MSFFQAKPAIGLPSAVSPRALAVSRKTFSAPAARNCFTCASAQKKALCGSRDRRQEGSDCQNLIEPLSSNCIQEPQPYTSQRISGSQGRKRSKKGVALSEEARGAHPRSNVWMTMRPPQHGSAFASARPKRQCQPRNLVIGWMSS